MIVALVVATVAAAGALAVFGAVTTVLGRPPGRAHLLAVAAVVALVALQGAVAVGQLFTGTPVPDQSTFLIYLVVSVCVLPILTQFATAEPTRWGGGVIAVGAIATAVAVLRLQDLWAVGGG